MASSRNQKTHVRLALALLTIVLTACGGGGDGDGGNDNGASSSTLKVSNLPVPKNYRPAGTDGRGHRVFVSAPIRFSLPADTVSFQIFMRGGDAQAACLNQVLDPDNVDILGVGARSILDANVDYCSALVPQGPQFTAKSGLWRYKLAAVGRVPDDIRVTLALRTGPLPSNASTLKVQPFLASGTYTPADIKPALDAMRQIYAQAGVSLRISNTIVLKEPAFRIASIDFTDPITRRLVGKGLPGFVNLFFVDDTDVALAGIAAGLPGSLGIASNRNGVLLPLNSNLDSNMQIDTSFLAETAGHEMGHFLGLFHTTERNGLQFDILPDTPECRRSTRDSNGDGIVLLDECRGLGINNLMFWVGDGVIRQTQITADQAQVINFSPIAAIQ